MTKILGPYSNTINEESGLLVDGFDTPPYVMMLHGRPYYAGMMEANGFARPSTCTLCAISRARS
ncbi:MAG: hypothetical protein R3C58_04280 [Parvularculaceae bacterium]